MFIEPAGLLVAAAAAILETPRLPDEDPAFAVLGGSGKASAGLSALWRRWQSAAASGWAGPRARSYISYYLVQDIRSNRKGYGEARTGAARLVESWEEQARALATSAEGGPTRLVTAHFPEITDERSRGVQRELLEGLDL